MDIRYGGILSKFLAIACLFYIVSVFLNWGWIKAFGPPYMSVFTAISLLTISVCRIAESEIETWSKSMSLALLGIVIGGNLSSMTILLLTPDLFLVSIPNIVPTSMMTSIGIITFCIYQMLVLFRETPESTFILDDILLHLALAPGGVSLLGIILSKPVYISSAVDVRVGINLLEMFFMATLAIISLLTNKHLFFWKFLQTNNSNKIIFTLLFLNQFIAPIVVGKLFGNPDPNSVGLELFVMLAGTIATLAFLTLQAVDFYKNKNDKYI